MDDRAIFKWERFETPNEGNNVSRVAWIAFPTDYLSREKVKEKKKVIWLEAAPSGSATYIELAYTYKTLKEVKELLGNGSDRKIVSYTPLPNREALLVLYYHGEWENNDMRSPATEGSSFPDLEFSAEDPNDTGRPVRITFGPAPKDGDAMILQELGGYRVER